MRAGRTSTAAPHPMDNTIANLNTPYSTSIGLSCMGINTLKIKLSFKKHDFVSF